MLWPPQEKDVPADELEDELEAEGIPAETMDSSTASKKKKKSKKKAVDAETTESAAYC